MPPLPSELPGYQFCTVEIFYFGVVMSNQFDHGGMQLVLVALRCSLRDSGHKAPLSAMIKVRSNWPVSAALMRK